MPSQAALAKARDEYTELHEGQPPSRVWLERPPRVPRHVRILGRLTEIQYRKRVTDGTFPYKHPFGQQHAFSEHAQPLIGVDRKGHLWILEGRYEVTPHGIEDLPWWSMRHEKLPPSPRLRLTTLGKLEFLRYKKTAGGVVTTEELRFDDKSRPTLAHDERGNLFVLGGPPVDTSIGEESMARRRSSRRNPHRGRKSGLHHRVIRTNPSRTLGASAKEAAMIGGATGLVVLAGSYGLVELSRRVPALARLSPNASAAVTAGIGIAAGTALGALGAPTVVGVGLAASGVAAAGMKVIENMREQRRAAAAAEEARRLAAAGPPAPTAPPGYLYSAGMPRGYNNVYAAQYAR